MSASGSRETLVQCQQRTAEALGERHVRGVVRGEVVPEFDDPRDQLLMTVPDDRQVEVVLSCLTRSLRGERPSHQGAAKPGSDLHVAQSGDVEIDVGPAE